MEKNGIKMESEYTLNFKDVNYKSYEASMLMQRMLDEFKDKKGFFLKEYFKNIKPKNYSFNLILIIKEKK